MLSGLFIAAVLLLAAAFLLLKMREQRRLGGLPDGDLIYGDNVAEDSPVLVSHRYGLKGTPDALVRTESGELISNRSQEKFRVAARPLRWRPHAGDRLLHSNRGAFGLTPPFMRFQYADRWFDEPYTPERKRWDWETCERLRQGRRQRDCRHSHSVAAKCRNWGQRPNCEQAL